MDQTRNVHSRKDGRMDGGTEDHSYMKKTTLICIKYSDDFDTIEYIYDFYPKCCKDNVDIYFIMKTSILQSQQLSSAITVTPLLELNDVIK
jgi:hypothetical protein